MAIFTLMNAINPFVIVLIILGIIAALVITLFLSLRTTRKLVDENNKLVGKLRESESAAAPRLPVASAPMPSGDSGFMEWFEQRMDQTRLYLRSDISLKAISGELGVSQRKISMALKADSRYGSLNEYLTAKRIEEACRLLSQKPFYKIESISQDSGFSSRKTFQTIFKKKTGMTPSEYRISASSGQDSAES